MIYVLCYVLCVVSCHVFGVLCGLALRLVWFLHSVVGFGVGFVLIYIHFIFFFFSNFYLGVDTILVFVVNF